jgi:hypothetical protein
LKFSTGTLQYSIGLAVNSNALLSGVFLDDFTYHSYTFNDMVGSQGLSKEKIKEAMDKDKEMRLQSSARFEYACIKAHVKYTVHHDRSIAVQEVLKESVYSDLILVSADESFTHFNEQRPSLFIKDLLADVQCPVMIIPREYRETQKIILLYDGKPSSVFAIKMFNYMMPWMQNIETEVLSVIDPKDNAELPHNELITEFVTCHYPQAKYTVLHGDAAEEIVNYLKKSQENILVVLGAYRRSTVSMWFKTSMADILTKEIDMPLFIAHNK